MGTVVAQGRHLCPILSIASPVVQSQGEWTFPSMYSGHRQFAAQSFGDQAQAPGSIRSCSGSVRPVRAAMSQTSASFVSQLQAVATAGGSGNAP